MKSLALIAALASGALAAVIDTSVDTHCPTVTETATVCSTCAVKECAMISTISNPCDCSDPVPTTTTSYPCSNKGSCPSGCATTMYVSATSTSTCPTKSSSSSSSSSSSKVTCTPTVTINVYPSGSTGTSITDSGVTMATSSGLCPFACSTGCIMDKFVTLPCGCDVAAGVVTKTETLPCATTSPCYQCYTGFPWTTTATDCDTTAQPTVTMW